MPELPSTAQSEIEQVRSSLKDLLHPNYDTDYNIARWIQGAGHNVPKATHMLRKHLKFRREKRLDTDQPNLYECKISQEYSPLSIVGVAGPDSDRLIVVDQAGKIDVHGVMKSVIPTEYIHQRYRNVEKVMKLLNEMETRLGRQCSCYYIFDLDGLHFDPTVVSTVTGPFRISWELIALHYREWVDKIIVINAPTFINVLWTAISPFIPEDGKHKIVFPGKNWRDDLLTMCDKEHLPVKYGGTIPDDLVLKEPKPVPKEKYWSPRPDQPHPNNLHKVSVPASKTRVLYYKCDAGQQLFFYMQCESEMHMGIYFGPTMDSVDDDMDAVLPWCPRAGLPAVDLYDVHPMEDGEYFAEGNGVVNMASDVSAHDSLHFRYYHFRIGNQASWLMATTFKILALDKNGNEVCAVNQNEKWIKTGQKFKK